MIASLNARRINYPSLDVFAARWLTESFASVRFRNEGAACRGYGPKPKKPWARLDPQFGRIVSQKVVRRIISVIRNSRHGGMLVYLPPELGSPPGRRETATSASNTELRG